jgi:ClpP class serine protease
MDQTLENQVVIELGKIARAVQAMQDLADQGELNAGNSKDYLVKIENLSKRIRQNLPQF